MGNIPILPPDDNEPKTEPVHSLFGVNAVDAFSEFSRHSANRQIEDDLVTVMDVDKGFTDWQNDTLSHPETGFLSIRGKDAKGLYEAFQEQAEAKYLELTDGLGNSNQRALFERRFMQHSQRSEKRIAAHEAREVDLHRRTSLGESSVRETRRAVELMNEGNEAGAADAVEMANGFLGQSLSGMAHEQRMEAEQMLTSGFHGEVFKHQLGQDPLSAAQYLFKNQKQIRPDVYSQLQQAARRKMDKAEGRSLFVDVYRLDTELPDLLISIDASDATEEQKAIASEMAEDHILGEQAEQVGREKQQIEAAEMAARSGLQMIDAGVSYEE